MDPCGYSRQYLNGFMDIRAQQEYQDFYHQRKESSGFLPEPIMAEEKVEVAKTDKQKSAANSGFAHLAGHLPQYGSYGINDEGRRRQSSNFFDMLTDP